MSIVKRLVIWLKWLVAGSELEELHRLKLRIDDLHRWCGHEFPGIQAGTEWLIDQHDYPCQFKGPHGCISDFREYLRSGGKDR